MKKFIFFILITGALYSTSAQTLTTYVNPFIGTDAHGHTYPGAVYPFGLVQLSPDTRKDGWDGCSGYHYSDSIIYGFSHTHLSGTGVSDYADILLKPFSSRAIRLQQNFLSEIPFASKFSHGNEYASPGYYRVLLEPDNILAEMTATARCGVHRYTFIENDPPMFYLDLTYRDHVLDSYLEQTGPDEIVGYRFSKAWAQDQRIFFVMKFSAPFAEFGILQNEKNIEITTARGTNLTALMRFSPEYQHITVKVGLSGVDIDGARKNLDAEVSELTFDEVVRKAESAWEEELSRILITDRDEDKKTVFYTSLYHTMIVPNIFSDVDGRYMGRDFQIHKAEGFDYYTVFSLWDTYRAYHPLMTIIDRKRTSDFINTFMKQYEQGGLLPVWEFASNETWCMIGYHAVPVITDAIMKDIGGFDRDIAFQAMKKSAMQNHFGLKEYRDFGYIPADKESESISKTLEYAYDDWCIAQTAKILGKQDYFEEYIRRSQYYKNIFNKESGFFRPKLNGNFLRPFDPREVNFHFTEANAWQYSMYVPHDVSGFIKLLGGDAVLCNKLDQLFSMTSQTTGRTQSDITGLIGQYAHGNEPSHHMAYLYAYCGQHHKSQEMADSIMNTFYTNSPDGLCGNEDCGQMSAWYVLSSLGFYPVNPADGLFVFGSPQFEKAEIRLENGKKFSVTTTNRTRNNKYIQKVFLNDIEYPLTYIGYDDILAGGKLHFEMASVPNVEYGFQYEHRPVSEVADYLIVPVPFFVSEGRTFYNSTEINIHTIDPAYTIYYTTDGTEPGKRSNIYTELLLIKESAIVKAVTFDEQNGFSKVAECQIVKIPEGRTIEIRSEYNPQYTAGGDKGLIDYLRGPVDFRTGYWQGYQNTDFEAVVNLEKAETVSKLALGCLQDARSWIWMPVYVEFYTSKNGKKWKYAGKVVNDISDEDMQAQIKDFTLKIKPVKTRFVKVFAKNYGTIPDWHPGAGGKAFIFTDEMIIE
jgi:predicted alpha-1,2-mannosidase